MGRSLLTGSLKATRRNRETGTSNVVREMEHGLG